MMKSFLSLFLLFCTSVASAAPPEMLPARHLDPSVMPKRLNIEGDQLVVDGVPVRGSVKKQLDYLEVVLARDAQVDPSELDFDRHRRALARKKVGLGVLCVSAPIGAVVGTVAGVAPMVAVAVAAPLQAGGLGLLFAGPHADQLSTLSDRVDRYGMNDGASRTLSP